MKAAALAFRLRPLIFLLLYLLGFLLPWQRPSGGGNGTLWLTLSTTLTHDTTVGLAGATMIVTIVALASLTLGAMLRVWGTAYLGPATMQAGALKGDAVVAGGPYGYLRNPLYLGSWLLAIGASILMPAAGAFFFLLAFTAFLVLLVIAEEKFLSAKLGGAYQEYCGQVPRLIPRLFPGIRRRPHARSARPRWLRSLLAETFPIAFTVCFAVFAWRYNAHILIKCLLISYGLSLVARALLKKPG